MDNIGRQVQGIEASLATLQESQQRLRAAGLAAVQRYAEHMQIYAALQRRVAEYDGQLQALEMQKEQVEAQLAACNARQVDPEIVARLQTRNAALETEIERLSEFLVRTSASIAEQRETADEASAQFASIVYSNLNDNGTLPPSPPPAYELRSRGRALRNNRAAAGYAPAARTGPYINSPRPPQDYN